MVWTLSHLSLQRRGSRPNSRPIEVQSMRSWVIPFILRLLYGLIVYFDTSCFREDTYVERHTQSNRKIKVSKCECMVLTSVSDHFWFLTTKPCSKCCNTVLYRFRHCCAVASPPKCCATHFHPSFLCNSTASFRRSSYEITQPKK